MSLTVSAPAKVILFGEHAVVHGQPAIAAPVSTLRASATVLNDQGGGLRIRSVDLDQVLPINLDSDLVDSALALTARLVLQRLDATPPNALITLESTIPMASGLGSGAAVSAALARAVAAAVGYDLPQSELNTIVFEIEKTYHGTPSGIDNTVIVYEQPVYFVRGCDIEILPIARPLTLVVADTGAASLTRVAVGDVRHLVESEPQRIQPVLETIGDIARQARTAITSGDVAALGPLMMQNHQHLQTLTVSSPSLDHLVGAAYAAGALGAKLSGGGRGGNMIALVPPDQLHQAETIRRALLTAGATRAFITTVEPANH